MMSAEKLEEIISPKFTEQVVLDIITKKSELSNVQIKKIKTAEGAKKGEAYLSNSSKFVVTATGTNSEGVEETVSIPVFVKYLPKNEAWRKTYRTAEFFENETTFYEKVWPGLDKFQESKNLKTKFQVPFMLSTYCDGINDYIALLDISYEGYRSSEPGHRQSYDYAVTVLKLLARFHALSLAMKNQQPEEFEKIATNLKEVYCAEKHRKWFTGFHNKLIAVVRDSIEKELPQIYLEKFNKLIDNDLFGTTVKLCARKGPLSVITHGDLCSSNVLLKYNPTDKIINEAFMIDFQMSRYTSLANDLTYFLYCCLDTSLLETHFDDFIKQYHQTLIEVLESLGSERNLVSLEDIHEEIKIQNPYGISMAIEVVPMSHMENNELLDLNAIQGTEARPMEEIWTFPLFKEQEKRQKVAGFVKFSVDRNLM